MRRALATLATATALLLSGCSAAEQSNHVPADNPVVETEPATTEPAMTDEEILDLALELAWQDMSPDQKQSICWGWDTMGPQWVVEQTTSGMPDADPQQVREFFEGKC